MARRVCYNDESKWRASSGQTEVRLNRWDSVKVPVGTWGITVEFFVNARRIGKGRGLWCTRSHCFVPVLFKSYSQALTA